MQTTQGEIIGQNASIDKTSGSKVSDWLIQVEHRR